MRIRFLGLTLNFLKFLKLRPHLLDQFLVDCLFRSEALVSWTSKNVSTGWALVDRYMAPSVCFECFEGLLFHRKRLLVLVARIPLLMKRYVEAVIESLRGLMHLGHVHLVVHIVVNLFQSLS